MSSLLNKWLEKVVNPKVIKKEQDIITKVMPETKIGKEVLEETTPIYKTPQPGLSSSGKQPPPGVFEPPIPKESPKATIPNYIGPDETTFKIPQTPPIKPPAIRPSDEVMNVPQFQIKGQKQSNLPVPSTGKVTQETITIPSSKPEVIKPIEIIPEKSKGKTSTKKKIIVGAGALATGAIVGNQLLDKDEEIVEKKISEEQKRKPITESPKEIEKIKKKAQSQAKKIEKKSPEISSIPIMPETNEELARGVFEQKDEIPVLDVGLRQENQAEQLGKSQEVRDFQVLMNQLAKISERGAAAYGGFKPLYGDVYDKEIELAEKKVEDTKERMRLQENDPSSPTSQAFKKWIERYGKVKIKGDFNASIGKELLPLAYREFEADVQRKAQEEARKEAAQIRKEEAEKNREFLKSQKEMEIEARKFQAKLLTDQKKTERETKQVQREDDYINKKQEWVAKQPITQSFNKIDRAKTLVDEAVKAPTGAGDIASLYSYITALDPDSVVREGEIKLSREAVSLWGNIGTGLSRLGPNPRVIPPTLLQDMQKYISMIHEQARDKYNQQVIKPIYNSFKEREIPERRLSEVDPFYKGEEIQQPQGKGFDIKSEVKIKKLMENNPGLSREKAIEALKAKGML